MDRVINPSEEELGQVLTQFDRLSELLIDTSSLIQIEKAGFLPWLSRVVHLYTIPLVREEYVQGSHSMTFPQEVQLLSRGNSKAEQLSFSTDEALIGVALSRRLPILSEDRKLLLRAEALGLEYYNALMMLEFIYYRVVDGGEKGRSASCQALNYSSVKQKLITSSRYSYGVLKYIEQLHYFIEKSVG